MLIRNPRYRLQVPHGLAILGALLLLAGTVTGVGGTLHSPSSEPALAATGYASSAESNGVNRPAEPVESMAQPPVKKHKRFKINLFLFRH
jgi:hypothetical protein